MTDKMNSAGFGKIISLEPLETDAYRVVVQICEGQTLETVCRVCHSSLESGVKIQGCTFDTREFNQEIMKGNIDTRAICSQVVNFHNSRPSSSKA